MNLVPPSSGKATSLYQSTRVYVAEDCTPNMVHRDNLQNPGNRLLCSRNALFYSRGGKNKNVSVS